MKSNEKFIIAFQKWYSELPIHRPSGGPARGTISAALIVLERLKSDFNLNLDSHRAAGQSQIKGVSGTAVARILANHGEMRPFIKEGGRTNRGGPGDIGKMLSFIATMRLETKTTEERNKILDILQSFLVDKVREYQNRQRLKVIYEPSSSTWQSIHNLLALAQEQGKEGPVAQYLVGAKLGLRFPNLQIGNNSYSTADDQLGRRGDYEIGDTVFHITVAPMPAIYVKCKSNIEAGLRVYLLVPDRCLIGAKQNTEAVVAGKIVVESIESFVGQNIEEISIFKKDRMKEGFLRLLETYNQRVNEVETDKSMLIEIPQNLLK
ncbi:MAG TPA: hypothetical protein DCK76_06855 [Desulfotomaculum sp.]|nr:MAG: Uncharacterized protein XD84_1138 [Desulfotomaculum sp. 46_80]HAG11089.1 hypothetical protein [Desulfotomaculum sp.]HBY03597.1 hypothetical protein [Desulfotomaculum sp.]